MNRRWVALLAMGPARSQTQPARPMDGSPATSTDTSGEILLQARIEPDADHDGFGDETQDACPGRMGSLSGCPAPTESKQKCRKHKRH